MSIGKTVKEAEAGDVYWVECASPKDIAAQRQSAIVAAGRHGRRVTTRAVAGFDRHHNPVYLLQLTVEK